MIPAPATLPGPDAPRRSWWRRHEALLQTVGSVIAVLALTLFWWRVSGSKSGVEDVLLADERGQQADLSALPLDLREAVTRTLRDGRIPVTPVTTSRPDRETLDEGRRAELTRVERDFARFPLVRAVALARAGLLDEAVAQLGKLAEQHPQSTTAQRLFRGASASASRGRGWER